MNWTWFIVKIGVPILVGIGVLLILLWLFFSMREKRRKSNQQALLRVFKEEYGFTPTAEEFQEWLQPTWDVSERYEE